MPEDLLYAREPLNAATIPNLREITYWGKGAIRQLRWSPNGQFLAVATAIGIYLYAGSALEEVMFLDTGWWVQEIAFTADNSALAAGAFYGEVQIWSLPEGRCLQHLPGALRMPIGSLAFTPDGQLLAVGQQYIGIHMWNWMSGQKLYSVKTLAAQVISLAFDSTGQTLHAAYENGPFQAFCTTDGLLLESNEGRGPSCHLGQFTPDGRLFAGAGSSVFVYEPEHQHITLRFYWAHDDREVVAITPDGANLAVSGQAGIVQIWDIATKTQYSQLDTGLKYAHDLALSPDGQTIAISGLNQMLQIWDVAQSKLRHIIKGFTAEVQSLAASPDTTQVLAGGFDGQVRCWEFPTGKPLEILGNQEIPIDCLAVSPDGQLLVMGSEEETITIWRLADGKLQALIHTGMNYQRSLIFTHNGKQLVIGSIDGIQIRECETYTLLKQWKDESVTHLALSPDGQVLASCSEENRVRLWSLPKKRRVRSLRGHQDEVWRVAFARNGAILVSGGKDGTVRLWNMSNGDLQQEIKDHRAPVIGLAFTTDDAVLVVGYEDGTFAFWRVADGSKISQVHGHTNHMTGFILTADGRLLISGGDDGILRIWGYDPHFSGTALFRSELPVTRLE